MALPNDLSRTTDLLGALQASDPNYTSDVNKKRAPRSFIRRTYSFATASVATNASIVANTANVGVRMKSAGRVLGVNLLPGGTSNNANGANYATIAVSVIDGNGNTLAGLPAQANTRDTANGGFANIVIAVAQALTVDSNLSNSRYVKGAWLVPTVTQTAGGQLVQAAIWSIDVEEEDVDGYPV